MIDDAFGAGERNRAPENQQTETGERVAFCQQCGKALTAETVRRAGSAVYCEPCLVARLEGQGTPTGTGPAAGWAPVNATTQTTGAPGQPAGIPAPINNEPNPGLAAILGIIPGVGAMYNGQYAKGIAHLVIFVLLEALTNDVNGVFGVFAAGWVIYQMFDAYHTAKARRDGTPLPNPFGLNEIGDRMGFGKSWPGSAARPATSATTAGWATAAAAGGSAAPPQQAPNWSGYVPPTNFGASAPPPPPPAPQPTAYASAPSGSTNWTQTPYTSTYAGEPSRAPAGAPVPPPVPPLPVRRFPIGAAWLIAVGLVFLLANLNGSWRLGGSWAVAIVLAALGTFILFRRIEMVRAWSKVSGDDDLHDHDSASRLTSQVICQARWPIMLLVLALLFALQAAGIRTLGQTWGIVLIAFGALLILERTVGRNNWYPVGTPGSATVPPPASPRKDGQ